jgi:hypothetical protein
MQTNETTRRDPVDAALLWTAGVSFATALALSSTFAPLFYVWAMGILAVAGIIAACVAIGSTFGDGDPVDDYFALQFVFGGMRLVGALLMALCGVSSND